MSIRQQLALETKHKLIAAARQLIRERGIGGVSVQDITARAGVSKGSFYTYYQKKEDVLGEIAYQNFGAIKEKYLAAGGKDIVRGYLTEYVAAIYEGGCELCKSWTANEISGKNGSICKFEMDCANAREILSAAGVAGAEDKAYAVTAFIYGIMTAWCMTDGKSDMMNNFLGQYPAITKILEQ